MDQSPFQQEIAPFVYWTRPLKSWTKATFVKPRKKAGAPPPKWSKPLPRNEAGSTMGIFSFYQAVRDLVEATGDTELVTLFQVAGNLNGNFYENCLPAEVVRSGLDNVGELVDKLEELLG